MGCGPSSSRPTFASRSISLGEPTTSYLPPSGFELSEECLIWRPMRGRLPPEAASRFFSAEGAFIARVAVTEGVLPCSTGVESLYDGGALAISPVTGAALAVGFYEALVGAARGWELSMAEWGPHAASPPFGAVIVGRLADGTPLFAGICRGSSGEALAGAALPHGLCAVVLPGGTPARLPGCSVLTARRLGQQYPRPHMPSLPDVWG